MEKITKKLVNAMTTEELVALTNRQKGSNKAMTRASIQTYLIHVQLEAQNEMAEVALQFLAGAIDSNTMKTAIQNFKTATDRHNDYWVATQTTEFLERTLAKQGWVDKNPELAEKVRNEINNRK